jgi:hypothetical protein
MLNAQGIGFQIIVDGVPLTEYVKDGKTYVAAPFGREYQIRYIVPRQYTPRGAERRWEFVTSVDGLCILTGKRATRDSRGYILTPAARRGSNDIKGFRLNANEVAAFQFGDRSDSYAAQLDKPSNIGAIGVIVFGEYEPPAVDHGMLGMESCGGASKGGGHSKGGHDMGTEFGRRTEQRTTTTEFERAHEVTRLALEYASYDSLVSAGIIQSNPPLGRVDAFADDSGCKPPKGWRG